MTSFSLPAKTPPGHATAYCITSTVSTATAKRHHSRKRKGNTRKRHPTRANGGPCRHGRTPAAPGRNRACPSRAGGGWMPELEVLGGGGEWKVNLHAPPPTPTSNLPHHWGLRIPQTPKHPNVQAFSDLLAEGDVAAVEDDRDAVERDRPALLPEVPRPREVAVLRVARELRRRVRLQLREGRRRGRSSSTTRTFTTLPSSLPSPPAGPA